LFLWTVPLLLALGACDDRDPVAADGDGGGVDLGPLPDGTLPDGPLRDGPVADRSADQQVQPVALQLFGFGDSVTDGFCASPGKSYVELLVQDLRGRVGQVTSSNGAISGSTSCDYTADTVRLGLHQRRVAADRYLVVITLGGNDLIHDYSCAGPRECAAYCSTVAQAEPWAAAFKQRMLGFLRVFRDELPGVRVFLANIYDPTDGVGDIENAPVPQALPPWPDGIAILERHNQAIAELAEAEDYVTLVDMRAAMLGHGIHHDDPQNPYYDQTDPTYWYCENLEDPNDRGYQAIREAFWAAIEPHL
jgi:lysophospholipase L1-like esterase